MAESLAGFPSRERPPLSPRVVDDPASEPAVPMDEDRTPDPRQPFEPMIPEESVPTEVVPVIPLTIPGDDVFKAGRPANGPSTLGPADPKKPMFNIAVIPESLIFYRVVGNSVERRMITDELAISVLAQTLRDLRIMPMSNMDLVKFISLVCDRDGVIRHAAPTKVLTHTLIPAVDPAGFVISDNVVPMQDTLCGLASMIDTWSVMSTRFEALNVIHPGAELLTVVIYVAVITELRSGGCTYSVHTIGANRDPRDEVFPPANVYRMDPDGLEAQLVLARSTSGLDEFMFRVDEVDGGVRKTLLTTQDRQISSKTVGVCVIRRSAMTGRASAPKGVEIVGELLDFASVFLESGRFPEMRLVHQDGGEDHGPYVLSRFGEVQSGPILSASDVVAVSRMYHGRNPEWEENDRFWPELSPLERTRTLILAASVGTTVRNYSPDRVLTYLRPIVDLARPIVETFSNIARTMALSIEPPGVVETMHDTAINMLFRQRTLTLLLAQELVLVWTLAADDAVIPDKVLTEIDDTINILRDPMMLPTKPEEISDIGWWITYVLRPRRQKGLSEMWTAMQTTTWTELVRHMKKPKKVKLPHHPSPPTGFVLEQLLAVLSSSTMRATALAQIVLGDPDDIMRSATPVRRAIHASRRLDVLMPLDDHSDAWLFETMELLPGVWSQIRGTLFLLTCSISDETSDAVGVLPGSKWGQSWMELQTRVSNIVSTRLMKLSSERHIGCQHITPSASVPNHASGYGDMTALHAQFIAYMRNESLSSTKDNKDKFVERYPSLIGSDLVKGLATLEEETCFYSRLAQAELVVRSIETNMFLDTDGKGERLVNRCFKTDGHGHGLGNAFASVVGHLSYASYSGMSVPRVNPDNVSLSVFAEARVYVEPCGDVNALLIATAPHMVHLEQQSQLLLSMSAYCNQTQIGPFYHDTRASAYMFQSNLDRRADEAEIEDRPEQRDVLLIRELDSLSDAVKEAEVTLFAAKLLFDTPIEAIARCIVRGLTSNNFFAMNHLLRLADTGSVSTNELNTHAEAQLRLREFLSTCREIFTDHLLPPDPEPMNMLKPMSCVTFVFIELFNEAFSDFLLLTEQPSFVSAPKHIRIDKDQFATDTFPLRLLKAMRNNRILESIHGFHCSIGVYPEANVTYRGGDVNAYTPTDKKKPASVRVVWRTWIDRTIWPATAGTIIPALIFAALTTNNLPDKIVAAFSQFIAIVRATQPAARQSQFAHAVHLFPNLNAQAFAATEATR